MGKIIVDPKGLLVQPSQTEKIDVLTPDSICYIVTGSCTQSCKFCFGPPKTLSVSDDKNGVKQHIYNIKRLAELGVQRLLFSGGEAMLYKHLGELVKVAKDYGFVVSLATTGDFVARPKGQAYSTHPTLDEFLKQNAQYLDSVSLPLDGSEEKVNRKMRTKGHFERVVRAVDAVRQYPHIHLKFTTVVSAKNINDIPDLIGIMCVMSNGIPKAREPRVKLFQFLAQGEATRYKTEFDVASGDFQRLKNKVGSMRVDANELPLHVTCYFNHQIDEVYTMVYPRGEVIVPSGQPLVYIGNLNDKGFRFSTSKLYEQTINLEKRLEKQRYLQTDPKYQEKVRKLLQIRAMALPNARPSCVNGCNMANHGCKARAVK